MSLLPWRVALRGVTRRRRQSLLLIATTALVVAIPTAASTASLTASFTSSEVASLAMGAADLQVRTSSYEQGRTERGAPQVGQAGITSLAEDRDIAVVLESASGSLALTGRWIPFRDPITAGILEEDASLNGDPELALTPSAFEDLGVELGDHVTIQGLDIDVVVTDRVSYAPDTAQPLAYLDPRALTASEREALIQGAVQSTRWLIQTDDRAATLAYLNGLGLQAMSRESTPAPEQRPLVDPLLMVVVFSVAGLMVLAAGGSALAASHRRERADLARLGAGPAQARHPIQIESTVVALLGAALALPVALGAAAIITAVGEHLASQHWGSLTPAWGVFGAVAAVVVLLAPLVTVVSSQEPRSNRRHGGRAARSHSRVRPQLLGARLAQDGFRGTALGATAIAVVVAVAGSSVLIADLAGRRYTDGYTAKVPESIVAVGLPRQLDADEALALAAATGTAVTEDRRAMIGVTFRDNPVPLVVETPLTDCLRQPSNSPPDCYGPTAVNEPWVAVLEPAQAAALLGRDLTTDEQAAVSEGDGLLLATSASTPIRLVLPGRTQAEAAEIGSSEAGFDLPIEPVSVLGYDGYGRMPGLIISPSTMTRWGLTLDATNTSYYLLTPNQARPSEQSVRAALPPDLAATADVMMDEQAAAIAAIARTTRTIVGAASAAAFLVSALLVLSWSAAASDTLRRLVRLGMGPRALSTILVIRGIRAVLPAALAGSALVLLLTWAFSRYVGIAVPVVGLAWLLPPAAALAALPLTTALRMRFGPEQTT